MAFRRLFLLPFTSNLTTIKPNVQQQLSTHIRAFSTLFSNTKHWESNFVKPTCLNSFSRQQSSLMGIHQKMKEALQINLGNLQARPEGKKVSQRLIFIIYLTLLFLILIISFKNFFFMKFFYLKF